MALAAPLVAWSSGGSPEAIDDGRDGWFVRENEDLATALAALEDEPTRRRVGEAARQTAEQRFSPDAVYPLIDAAYRDARSRAKESRP